MSVNGDPFTPDAERRMNVTLSTVVTSFSKNHRVLYARSRPGDATADQRSVPTIRITGEMIRAVEARLAGQAWYASIEPIVNAYQTEILKKGQWRSQDNPVSPGATGSGSPALIAGQGEVILDVGLSYRMSDEDFAVFSAECSRAAALAGLTRNNPEEDPLLAARHEITKADWALIDAIAPALGITADQINSGVTSTRSAFLEIATKLMEPYVNRDRMVAVGKAISVGSVPESTSLDM